MGHYLNPPAAADHISPQRPLRVPPCGPLMVSRGTPTPLQAFHGLKNPAEMPLEPLSSQFRFFFVSLGLSLFNTH